MTTLYLSLKYRYGAIYGFYSDTKLALYAVEEVSLASHNQLKTCITANNTTALSRLKASFAGLKAPAFA